MNTDTRIRQYGSASLVSVMLTAVAITADHLYTLGHSALILGTVLLVVPAALLTWFRHTGSTSALFG